MALVLKDRVLESSTSTGTGSFTLTGAQTGYQSFTAIGNGNTTYYTIQGKNSDGSLTGEWEVGVGTWATGNTLARNTVFANSLGTTALISFSAGSKDVFVTYPSDKALLGDTSAVSSTGTGSVVLSDSPSLSGAVTIGSTTGTDTLIFGRSTGAQTVNIATGSNSSATKSVNIGTNGGGGATNIIIGTGTGTSTTFLNGNVRPALLTASQAVFTDASKNLVSKATTGTGSVVLSDSPSLTGVVDLTACTDVAFPSSIPSSIVTTGTIQSDYLVCNGSIQLNGSATINATLDTNQTTGTLTIGGTGATGTITLGQSTGAQTVNIATGTTSTAIVNIGGTGSSTGAITIGRSTGTQTITLGSGNVTTGATRTINIGTTSAGTGISNITIGKQSTTVNHTTVLNGRYVTLNAATTLSLASPTISIGQNLAQTTTLVADLTSLIGVVNGSRAFVTDALSPQTGSIAVGGGAVAVPVYYDGTNWICDSGLGTLSGSIVGTTDTQTLTNKRITSRSSTTTSSATPTINTDNTDIFGLTAQAVDITSFTTNLSGTPTDGQKLWIYIVGTAARAITWGASFESSTATLPTTTVTTNRLDVGFVWNVATSKWRCVAVA